MNKIETYNKQVSITELTDLIHRSYQQLADLGFKYWGTYQTEEDTLRRISRGECYVSFIDGTLVGTVTLNLPDTSSNHPTPKKPNVTTFNQFAVDPNYQKQGIGSEMMEFIEQRAKELGMKSLSCDTAEGATHLIKMYLKRGYQIVDKEDWKHTNYISVILRKELK